MCLIINLSDFNRNESLKLIFNYCSRGNYYNYNTVSNAFFAIMKSKTRNTIKRKK